MFFDSVCLCVRLAWWWVCCCILWETNRIYTVLARYRV